MILAWLRGPVGSPTGYFHSEGACCQSDVVGGVEGAHKHCRVDTDYTLRKALDHVRYGDDYKWNDVATEWCSKCSGYDGECIFCHTANELLSQAAISQRKQALAIITEVHGFDVAEAYRAATER